MATEQSSSSSSRNELSPRLERNIPRRDFSPSYYDSDPVAGDDGSLANQQPLLLSFHAEPENNVFPLTNSEITTILGSQCVQSLGVCVAVRKNQGFHFNGHVKAVILGGTISIMGVELGPSSEAHTLFAPRSHPAPSFTCITSAEFYHSLSPRLTALLRGRGAFALFPSCSGVESFERISPRYRGLFGGNEQYSLGIPGFQIVEGQVQNPMLHPPGWKKSLELSTVAAQSGEPFVGLIHGPKGSGKSTFFRMLTNTLVSRSIVVAYLDCDLGQSEFSPPGLISLHLIHKTQFGPSFTHPLKPYSSRYIGTATVKADPAYYLACISSLLEVFLAEIQGGIDIGYMEHDSSLPIPLIVNTQGWVKGLGANLSCRISDMIKPSHIFTLGKIGGDAFEPNIAGAVHHELEAISPREAALTLNAHDARELSLVSYFHSALQSEDVSWSTSSSLCSMNPWEIQCRLAIDYIAISGAEGENVVPEELENALVGSIVGLIRSEIQGRHEVDAGFPYIQGGELPPPAHSECVGVALVRYASGEEGVIHLITPVDGDQLASCRVLVKGDIEVPVSAMLNYASDVEQNTEAVTGKGPEALFGVERRRVPFLQWTTASTQGAAVRRARRNVMRRGQV